MRYQLKHPLSVVVVLAGVLSLPLMVSVAAAERDYEHEGRRSSARVNQRDLRSFDAFLDSHWDTAQELYSDPELINNDRFLRGHRDLRDWLEDHQEAAQAIQADPRAAIWQKRSAERGDREEERLAATGRISERDLRSFEDYLNSHDETAQLLYQNPDLINDRRFVRNHDALHDWLEDHREAAATIQANPQKFLWRERSVGATDVLRQLLK
jgi:hypothetical protein